MAVNYDEIPQDEIVAESSRTNFKPHPPGQHQGVIVDVRNLGMLPVKFKGEDKGLKPHVLIIWQTDERIKIEDDAENKLNGQRYIVSKRYVNSLADNARLRKDIEKLKGRLTGDEERRFNLESLIGLNCLLTIEHSKDGKYANVMDVTGWNTKFGNNLVNEGFVRLKDKKKQQAQDGEQDKLQGAVLRLRNLIGLGQTYGLKPQSEIDYDRLSLEAVERLIAQWGAAIDQAKEKQAVTDEVFDGEDEDGPSPFAEPGDPDYSNDPSKVQASVDKAHVPQGVSASAPAAAPAAAQASNGSGVATKFQEASQNSDPEGEAAFGQKASEIANAKWVTAGNEPLQEHVLKLIDIIEEAELDATDIITNPVPIGKINEFLKSMNRKPITRLTDLKTAQAALVGAKVADATIVW